MGSYATDLDELVARLRPCRTFAQLRGVLMDHCRSLIAGDAYGVYLLDERLRPTEVTTAGVPDRFVLQYEEIGRELDPVMEAVTAYHAPVHNLQVRSLEQWHREPLYQHVSAPHGVEHFLTIPVLRDDRVALTVHVARRPSAPPFTHPDVFRASGLACHLSLQLAGIAARALGPSLTERELEIARLVAKGLNNAEIGACVAISRNTVKAALKRIFAKLEVDARAELVSRLHEYHLL
jgi:DNA-binding CsgD family transcriptional regulator